MKKVCLLLDTSLGGVASALVDMESHQILWKEIHSQAKGGTRHLSCCVRRGLEACCLQPADISQVTVSVGPGSFTGIRVGLSFVYGLLAASTFLEVASVSSLQLLAEFLSEKDGVDVCVLSPSTKTHGYQAQFVQSESRAGLFEFVNVAPGEKVYVTHDSLELSRVLESQGLAFEVLGRDVTLEKSLVAMASRLSGLQFNQDYPHPQYYREPSVVERLKEKEKLCP